MQKPALPDNETGRLAVLRQYRVLDTEAQACFDRITCLAAQIFEVPTVLVSLVDRARQWFKSRQGLEVCQTPREVSFCAHVVSSGQMLVVENTLLDERFADNPLVIGEPGIRFYAGAPLRYHRCQEAGDARTSTEMAGGELKKG